MGMQMLGCAMALFGWIGVIVICSVPMWRVTAFIGSNIVTAQTIWEGIWMNCVVQSTGQMQCKILCLAPVSWTASIIIRDFYNPALVSAQKRELGASLYIGWGAGALLVLGGGLLCANCPRKDDDAPSVKYLINKAGGNSKEESLPYSIPTKTYI